MSISEIALLSATLAARGKDPYAAATLATYICRLGKSVAKIRLAECNGELTPSDRDWHTKHDQTEAYHAWNDSVNRMITRKSESIAKKVDLLNDELRTLGLHADDHGAGGLYLTINAPGKEFSAEKVHITIV